MALTETDLLYTSLVGSRLVKFLPRLGVIQNELQKHVLPVLPFLPLQNTEGVPAVKSEVFEGLNMADPPTPEEKQFFPLSLSIDEGQTWFLLPYETMINISSKNTVVKRNVAKWKESEGVKSRIGTIKERFNQDDWQIDITGVLIGSIMTGKVDDCFPINDFQKLVKILKKVKVRVKCPPLELLDISTIVIEDFSFPFTKGENVQAYTITAYSDYSYNLILD